MSLALTSDFPSTPNRAVFDLLRSGASPPRIACMAPFTAAGRERFPALRQLFDAHGFSNVEYCDIDEGRDDQQLAHLDEYDVLYLTGGDPIGFRRNLVRGGLDEELRRYQASDGLIVGASGGAMQLTQNLSLFALLTVPLDEVLASHAEYRGLGVVSYEILPHLNRLDAEFVETVRRYSEQVEHDVIALTDGAALLHAQGDGDDYHCYGKAERFRRGEVTSIESAAG